MRKYFLGIMLLLAFSMNDVFAKDYAYVYIEGDKQTPFYVKLEGQMMPRLGKNYCILPNLDAGVTNIEILFQQNLFPPQKFIVKIPEGGSRGFLLKKVNEKQFALYDLQQSFYLVSGNTINDDRLMPVAVANATPTNQQGLQQVSPAESLPAFTPPAKDKSKKKTDAAVTTTEAPKSQRTFIPDMELNSGVSVSPAVVATVPVVTNAGHAITKDTGLAAADADEFEDEKKPEDNSLVAPGIPNSDCKTAMSNDAFEDFATKILDQTTDDDKLKVLNKDKNRYCFTTEQVRIIANNLETQSGRYEVTRILFSRTSDQDNYPKLEVLFKTNYLKDKFKEIMNPK